MFDKQNLKKLNWLLPTLALGAVFCACSDNSTAGTSEEAEGVVAIAGKQIAGVSQKGPFVKGSEVTLRETSKDGNFEPTGREFTTKTISNKGDFKFDDIDLESQYVLLSVDGHYKREYNDEKSACPMRLDAVSNLEKRETVNINLLTHFEFKRVLNLVKEGKTFAEAKKQAAKEGSSSRLKSFVLSSSFLSAIQISSRRTMSWLMRRLSWVVVTSWILLPFAFKKYFLTN